MALGNLSSTEIHISLTGNDVRGKRHTFTTIYSNYENTGTATARAINSSGLLPPFTVRIVIPVPSPPSLEG